MKDITSLTQGLDMGILDAQTPKAGNILSIQIGSLEYAPELGIDLKYFLSEDFQFQNASFKSYLVQVLAENGINVATVVDTVENLFREYTFNIRAAESSTGLMAR